MAFALFEQPMVCQLRRFGNVLIVYLDLPVSRIDIKTQRYLSLAPQIDEIIHLEYEVATVFCTGVVQTIVNMNTDNSAFSRYKYEGQCQFCYRSFYDACFLHYIYFLAFHISHLERAQ